MRRLPNTYPGDKVKWPNSRGTISIGAADAGSKVLFYNETPVNLDLDFYNGDTDVLHAWEANFWYLDGETADITWAIDVDSLNVVNPPINAVFSTIYNPEERLNDKAYPMPLIRQIGGQQAIVSSASTVVNDGNALLQVIEATLQGHGSSDVIINNDGSFTLKGAGLLAAVGILIHILGNLTVDGTLTQTGAASFNAAGSSLTTTNDASIGGSLKTNTIRDNTNGNAAIDLSAGTGAATFPKQVTLSDIINLANSSSIDAKTNATHMDYHVPGTSKHTFYCGAVAIADIKPTGIGMYSNQPIGFSNGSIQRIGFAAFTPPSGISTITHNFGFVPTIALWQGGQIANTNPGTTTAAIYNCLANTCTINNFAAVNGFLLYIQA